MLAAALAYVHEWPACESPPCAKPAPPAGVLGLPFEYTFDGEPYEGYVALLEQKHSSFDGKTHLPIALIVHGMDGEGELEQFRADQLALLGFVAFAVDLFGQGKRPNGDFMAGQEYVTESYADMERLQRQLAAQVEALAAYWPIADADNFIVAGYCYGGNIALEYVRGSFPGLRAAVSFHGTFLSAPSTTAVPPLSAAVQLHHADDDFQDLELTGGWGDSGDSGMIGDDGDNTTSSSAWGRRMQLRAAVSVLSGIEDEMRGAGAERWMTIRYGRVGHAWTYPTSDEYKEFEAIQSHDASFALYRQLGLVTDELAGTPCITAGAACGHGLTCACPATRRRRRLLFATTQHPAADCVCA